MGNVGACCFSRDSPKAPALSANVVGSAKDFPWQSKPYICPPAVSAQGRRYAEEFVPRPSDVIICTFPKTGTTYLQQVCEQLRTGGDMNFSEITEVQPWIDLAWDLDQDLNADQRAFPRMFKSHHPLSSINPGAKYVTMIRDPEKTLLSAFTFFKDKGRKQFMRDDVNQYADTGHWASNDWFGANMFQYYVELWQARHSPNVLVLCYESMVSNPRPHIKEIATFIGVECDEKLLNTVVEMSSMAYMKEHDHQFDSNFQTRRQAELGRSNFVEKRSSKVGMPNKEVLSDATKDWLRSVWREQVEVLTGIQSYEDMASSISADIIATSDADANAA